MLIDGFTKFSILKPTVYGRYHMYVWTHDKCDRGTAYTGKEFEQMCKAHNIVHIRNTTATPRANGQCERLNQTILSMLTTTCTTETDLDKEIGRVQWSINNVLNKATKSTSLLGIHQEHLMGMVYKII